MFHRKYSSKEIRIDFLTEKRDRELLNTLLSRNPERKCFLLWSMEHSGYHKPETELSRIKVICVHIHILFVGTNKTCQKFYMMVSTEITHTLHKMQTAFNDNSVIF